ncbi:hypothetical protein BLX87_15165 [Bacillus sp. VT-16-64]|nr:hypothetical protein BLX87_15165 [Bacillus sp. VT-16-64]
MEKRVSEGKFCEDLYDRLNVLCFEVSSLRQRKQDIPLLVEDFDEQDRGKSRILPDAALQAKECPFYPHIIGPGTFGNWKTC